MPLRKLEDSIEELCSEICVAHVKSDTFVEMKRMSKGDSESAKNSMRHVAMDQLLRHSQRKRVRRLSL